MEAGGGFDGLYYSHHGDLRRPGMAPQGLSQRLFVGGQSLGHGKTGLTWPSPFAGFLVISTHLAGSSRRLTESRRLIALPGEAYGVRSPVRRSLGHAWGNPRQGLSFGEELRRHPLPRHERTAPAPYGGQGQQNAAVRRTGPLERAAEQATTRRPRAAWRVKQRPPDVHAHGGAYHSHNRPVPVVSCDGGPSFLSHYGQ